MTPSKLSWLFPLACLTATSSAFQTPSSFSHHHHQTTTTTTTTTTNNQWRLSALPNYHNNNDNDNDDDSSSSSSSSSVTRRSAILASTSTLTSGLLALTTINANNVAVANAEDSSMYSPKFVQSYDDFIETSEGWSYKDVKVGSAQAGRGDGEEIKDGDRVVFDWSGYTIGYFGRPFEAKGGPQGGAFDKEIDYARTVISSHTLIPGLESSLRTMKPGGIRQVIIPYGPLSYPQDDLSHEKVGPKPTTFSGQRALNFVLENPRVDRTLLFNVKLIRVDRSDGKGGFIRG